jgi:hypothetical protein
VRLQAFVAKDSQRYCCSTVVVPWEACVHKGRPGADRREFGGVADRQGGARHMAREDVPQARRMDRRARPRLGLRRVAERHCARARPTL